VRRRRFKQNDIGWTTTLGPSPLVFETPCGSHLVPTPDAKTRVNIVVASNAPGGADLRQRLQAPKEESGHNYDGPATVHLYHGWQLASDQ
jgi:hypothetical protein